MYGLLATDSHQLTVIFHTVLFMSWIDDEHFERYSWLKRDNPEACPTNLIFAIIISLKVAFFGIWKTIVIT